MTSRVRASILALTFAAFVAIPSVAAAQEKAVVGVKAGINMAKLSGDDVSDAKNLAGANAGLFVSKGISKNVGIRGEGAFSQQGAKFEDGGEDGKIKLTYINWAALLTAGPSSSGNTRFSVFTGPQVGLRTSAKLESDGSSVDFKDQVKGTDFSWVLGAMLQGGRFGVDARWAQGLSSIAKDGDSVKNKVISLNVNVNLTK